MNPIIFYYFMNSGLPFLIKILKIERNDLDINEAINNFIKKMETMKIKIIINDNKIDIYDTDTNNYICSRNINQ